MTCQGKPLPSDGKFHAQTVQSHKCSARTLLAQPYQANNHLYKSGKPANTERLGVSLSNSWQLLSASPSIQPLNYNRLQGWKLPTYRAELGPERVYQEAVQEALAEN